MQNDIEFIGEMIYSSEHVLEERHQVETLGTTVREVGQASMTL
jgi:hypothetical protein